MNLIDMHCDTLGKLLYGRMTQGKMNNGQNDADQDPSIHYINKDLKNNDFCISIPGMQKAGTMAQFFACFTYLKASPDGYEGCYRDALRMTEILSEQCSLFPDEIAQAFCKNDILKNASAGKISALLTVEEGGILNGHMERLQELYDHGVRLITPMWNFENCLGSPNSKDPEIMRKGLTPFGMEFAENCGQMGIVLDVSHASDGTFRDILAHTSGPVVASHSNCRALCNHPRNLTDEMIRALANRGGVAGLNLYGAFLNGSKESRIEVMVKHILHMINTGGNEFPAIGTDFDGFSGMTAEDIPTVAEMDRLWDGLHKAGIGEDELERIRSKNILAVLP